MMVVKNRHFTKNYPLVVSLLNPTREEEWTWYRNGPRLRSVSHGAKPDNAKQAGGACQPSYYKPAIPTYPHLNQTQ